MENMGTNVQLKQELLKVELIIVTGGIPDRFAGSKPAEWLEHNEIVLRLPAIPAVGDDLSVQIPGRYVATMRILDRRFYYNLCSDSFGIKDRIIAFDGVATLYVGNVDICYLSKDGESLDISMAPEENDREDGQ